MTTKTAQRKNRGTLADYVYMRARMWRELERNDGAVLMWQSEFDSVDWEWLIDNGDAVADFETDLYVHPQATKVAEGSYTLAKVEG